MIIAQLKGGLGNQMFQYAAGLSLATHRNVDLLLDVSLYENQGGEVTPRRFGLNCFAGSHKFASKLKIFLYSSHSPVARGGRLIMDKISGSPPIYYKEKSFSFDQDMLGLPANVYLDGYWQSERYFLPEEKLIRSAFRFINPPSGENIRIAKEISSKNSISVHFRRGDYASCKKTSSFHGIPGLEDYYYKAINHLSKLVEAPRLYIFSDEPDWIESNFHISIPYEIIRHNGTNQGYEDLRLMSLCPNHIIANSSFSWWGAWLSDCQDKQVIAPKNWFMDNSIDTRDLIPSSWRRL